MALNYGESGASLADTIARMQAASAAEADLQRKAEERAAAEERSGAALRENAGARGVVGDAATAAAEAILRSTSALSAETSAIDANTAAWRRNAGARDLGGVATAEAAAAGGAGGGRRSPPTTFAAPLPEPDPGARSRLEASLAAQAQADAAARTAARAYSASIAPGAGAGAEDQAALLGQREAARQQAAAARQETVAAQRDVQAQDALRLARQAQIEQLQRDNAAIAAAEAAAQREAAARIEAAGRLIATGGAPQLGAGPPIAGLLPASIPGRPIIPPPPTPATAERSFIAGGDEGLTQRATAATAAEHATAGLSQAQLNLNRAVNESVATYAASSQALQRHGALTSEFIQAFARGEVTLREFQSQMLTTIGKFGGWAIAGGLVYGAFRALKDLGKGAVDTQSGIEKLKIPLPDLNSSEAAAGFRRVAQETVTPISDVANAQYLAARSFRTQDESLSVARTALKAYALDNVNVQDTLKTFTALHTQFGQSAAGVSDIFDKLNVGQQLFGARLQDTLAIIQRAAPTWKAAGGDLNTLAAAAVAGARAYAGQGAVVGTSLGRIGVYAQQPRAQAALRGFGIDTTQNIGDELIQAAKKAQTLGSGQREELAKAFFGGTAQGGGVRGLGPLLAIFNNPDYFLKQIPQQFKGATGTSDTDLQQLNKRLDRQFKETGITLQSLGSELESSGLLSGVNTLIGGINLLGHSLEQVLGPITSVTGAIAHLPGPLKELLGLGVAGLAAQSLNRRFAPTLDPSRVGLGFLDNPDRQTLRRTTATTRSGLTFLQNQQESASQAQLAQSYAARRAQTNLDRFQGANAGALAEADAAQKANAELTVAQEKILKDQVELLGLADAEANKYLAAQQATRLAEEDVAAQTKLLATLTNRRASVASRVQAAADAGVILPTGGPPNAAPLQTAETFIARGGGAVAPESAATPVAGPVTAEFWAKVNQSTEASIVAGGSAAAARMSQGIAEGGAAASGSMSTGLLSRLRDGMPGIGGILGRGFGASLTAVFGVQLAESLVQGLGINLPQQTQQALTEVALGGALGGAFFGPAGALAGAGIGLGANALFGGGQTPAQRAAQAQREAVNRDAYNQAYLSGGSIAGSRELGLAPSKYDSSSVSTPALQEQIVGAARGLAALKAKKNQSDKDKEQEKAAEDDLLAYRAALADRITAAIAKDPGSALDQLDALNLTAKDLAARGQQAADQAKRSGLGGAGPLATSTNIAPAAKPLDILRSNYREDQRKAAFAYQAGDRTNFDAFAKQVDTDNAAIITAIQDQLQRDLAAAHTYGESRRAYGAALGRFSSTQKEITDQIVRDERQAGVPAAVIALGARTNFGTSWQQAIDKLKITDKNLKTRLAADVQAFQQIILALTGAEQDAKANALQSGLSQIQSQSAYRTSQIQTLGPAGDLARQQSDLSGLQRQLAFAQGHGASQDQIVQILTQINDARRSIADSTKSLAQTTQSDAQALVDAQASYQEAGIDPFNKPAIDKVELSKLQQDIAFAQTPADRVNAEAAARSAASQLRRDVQQQKYNNIEFDASIGRLDTEQEISKLSNLLKTLRGNEQLRRDIVKRIYDLKNQQDTSGELAVGNITLPTIYDVRRLAQGGLPHGLPNVASNFSAVHNAQVRQTNHYHFGAITSAEGGKHVARSLERLHGTRIRAALRSAGLRG